MIKTVEILDEAGIKYTMGKRFHCDRELECKKVYRAESFDWENAGKEEKEDHLIKTCRLDDTLFPIDDLWRISYHNDPATKEKAAVILRENGFHIVMEDDEDIVLNAIHPPCNHLVSDYWQGYEMLKNMGYWGSPSQLWLVDAIRMIEEHGQVKEGDAGSDNELKKISDKVETGIYPKIPTKLYTGCLLESI